MNSKVKDLLINEKKAGDLLLLYEVLEKLSTQGEITISHEELAIKMKRSRPTIKKLLQTLEDHKIISNKYGKIILGENNE